MSWESGKIEVLAHGYNGYVGFGVWPWQVILKKRGAGLGRDLVPDARVWRPLLARQTGVRVSTCPPPPSVIGDERRNEQGPVQAR
jgi:hypothetical protein